MKRVLTAVVLVPIVLIIILRAPVPVLSAVAAVVAILGVREFLELSTHYGVEPIRLPTYIFVVVLFVATALQGAQKPLVATGTMLYAVGFAAVIAPFLFLVIGMKRQELRTALPAAAASVVAFIYVAVPLGLLVQVRGLWAGAFLVLYLLVIVWIGDIAAFYTGRLIGRHKLAPRISPGKTWEGAVASFIAAIIAGWLLFGHAFGISLRLFQAGLIERPQGYFALEIPALWTTLLLSAVINIGAQLGDLVESLIKRGAGVKDSGALLPGHGGMLDRIDALLLAAPVLWYYAAWRVMS
jgi:phosphatidate cytidylyltransferase